MLEQPRESATRCPNCEATTLNVQGVAACPECAWVADADGSR